MSPTNNADKNLYPFFFTAPDKNPENIKIEGHLPHEMNINWEVRSRAWPFITLLFPYSAIRPTFA